ncbi:MAG: hypothetical protein QME05_05670 [Candidatus Margulisbacteria bacterium]|nr:hypothetical protein [Candidatus Margulisiibacteriota bacterium]
MTAVIRQADFFFKRRQMDDFTAKAASAEEAFAELKKRHTQVQARTDLTYIGEDWMGAQVNMGRLYAFCRRQDKAIAMFEEVLKINPLFSMAVEGIAILHMKTGNFGEVLSVIGRTIKALREVSAMNPLSGLGGTLGIGAEGALLNRRVALTSGRLPFYFQFAAEAESHQGKLDQAMEMVTAASRIAALPTFLLTQVIILIQQDKIGEAKKLLAQVEAALTGDKKGVTSDVAGRCKKLAADILVQEGKWQEAGPLYQEAVDLLSTDFDLEYFAIDARTSWISAVEEQASAERNAALFMHAKDLCQQFVNQYPFSAHARTLIIVPLLCLEHYDEALEHVRWFKDNLWAVNVPVLANLLIICDAQPEGEGPQIFRELTISIAREIADPAECRRVALLAKEKAVQSCVSEERPTPPDFSWVDEHLASLG